MQRLSSRVAVALIALLATMLWATTSIPSAHAATDTVTDCTDTVLYYPGTTNPYAGPGTLRAVIQNAAAGDTITFACSGTTYVSGLGVMYLDKNLTIDGVGQSVTLGGGACGLGLFGIENNATVTLRNLTIANCQTGITNVGAGNGAVSVLSGSTLSVDYMVFSGNRDGTALGTGAIFNLGTLHVSNSTFSGNVGTHGGGIENYGCAATLTVTNSTFSGNDAYYDGAGIVNYCGTATISNSTFNGNTVAHGGSGGGGGIASSGTLHVTNSTFSANKALDGVGGAIMNTGTATVTNSTLSGNTAVFRWRWSKQRRFRQQRCLWFRHSNVDQHHPGR